MGGAERGGLDFSGGGGSGVVVGGVEWVVTEEMEAGI